MRQHESRINLILLFHIRSTVQSFLFYSYPHRVPTNHLDGHAILKHVGRSWEKLMLDLVAYVDGGSLGNPGPAGVGVVIEGAESGGIVITKSIGRQDNNVAKYLPL